MYILYFTSVIFDRSLNNPLLFGDSVTSTVANKVQCVQQILQPSVSIVLFIKSITLIPMLWSNCNCTLLTLSLIQIRLTSKSCASLLETGDLRDPTNYIRDIALFFVCSTSKWCPSARSASVANVVCKEIDICGSISVLIVFHNRIFFILMY
jgi:hypothetical protein